MAALKEFLRAAMGQPFVWGSRDCALWAGDWASLCVGYDVMTHLRGKYHTAQACARIVRANGGMIRMADRVAAEIGARELISADELLPGDIACLPNKRFGGLLAIYVAPRFAAKASVGLCFLSVPPLKAWRLPMTAG